MSNGELDGYICNKNFPSQKSLFCHMISHPDRLWKGVQPPTPSVKHGSSSPNSGTMEENKYNNGFGAVVAPNKSAIDLSKSLPPSWLKTYKRGRECIYSGEVVEAVKKVMSLSQGSWSCYKDPQLPEDANLNEDGVCDRMNGGKPLSMDSKDEKATLLWIVRMRIKSIGPYSIGDFDLNELLNVMQDERN